MSDYIARCLNTAEPCDGFGPLCNSDQHRQRVEQHHMESRHAEAPPATDELCQQMFEQHADESEVVILAIETSARMNNGRVDPDEVGPLIPPGVTPQVIGSVYNVLSRPGGRLRRIDEGISRDTHGRNAGKVKRIYALVDAPSVERPA